MEVVSRHLPALGMRNRGKGVRALVSLCQQAPRSAPRPACLLVATLKDKRGTRYEVRAAAGPPRAPGGGGGGAWARELAPGAPHVSGASQPRGGFRGRTGRLFTARFCDFTSTAPFSSGGSRITVFPFSKSCFFHRVFASVKKGAFRDDASYRRSLAIVKQ